MAFGPFRIHRPLVPLGQNLLPAPAFESVDGAVLLSARRLRMTAIIQADLAAPHGRNFRHVSSDQTASCQLDMLIRCL